MLSSKSMRTKFGLKQRPDFEIIDWCGPTLADDLQLKRTGFRSVRFLFPSLRRRRIMPVLHRDYETHSLRNLPDVGAWHYSTHASTNVLCCAYAVDDGPVKVWRPGHSMPPEFLEAARDPAWLVSAFNDNFERQIEAHIMGPRYGWPIIPIERHRCLQASALSLALPASLDGAATALGLAEQKDKAGHALMMQMSKPRKPRKDENPAGVYWHGDGERLGRLCDYCRQDVRVERALHARIGFLGPEEQRIWELDAAIDDRGIFIDDALALGAIKIDEAAHAAIDAELQAITDGAVTSVDQTARLIAWLGAHDCVVTDIKKRPYAGRSPGRPSRQRRAA